MPTSADKTTISTDPQHARPKSELEKLGTQPGAEFLDDFASKALAQPDSLNPEAILALQRKAGNQAISRLMAERSIQPNGMNGGSPINKNSTLTIQRVTGEEARVYYDAAEASMTQPKTSAHSQNTGYRKEKEETRELTIGKGAHQQRIALHYTLMNPQENWGEYEPFRASNQVTSDEYSQIKTVIEDVFKNLGDAGSQLPNPIHILIEKVEGPAQQALILERGHNREFRLVLKINKTLALPGASLLTDSISGKLNQEGSEAIDQGWGFSKEKKKKALAAKNAITHEMGHMLHGFGSDAEYRDATTVPGGLNDQLNHHYDTGAPQYKEWSYAIGQTGNPAEVVAEVFLACMNGRNIPRGLAAVYLAYKGAMNSKVIEQISKVIPDWVAVRAALNAGNIVAQIGNYLP
jgi:hypothetical protein